MATGLLWVSGTYCSYCLDVTILPRQSWARSSCCRVCASHSRSGSAGLDVALVAFSSPRVRMEDERSSRLSTAVLSSCRSTQCCARDSHGLDMGGSFRRLLVSGFIFTGRLIQHPLLGGSQTSDAVRSDRTLPYAAAYELTELRASDVQRIARAVSGRRGSRQH
jgi:hypothetical protein